MSQGQVALCIMPPYIHYASISHGIYMALFQLVKHSPPISGTIRMYTTINRQIDEPHVEGNVEGHTH